MIKSIGRGGRIRRARINLYRRGNENGENEVKTKVHNGEETIR